MGLAMLASFALALLALSGCDSSNDSTTNQSPAQTLIQRQPFFAMGTMVEVVTYGADKKTHTAATREIENTFTELAKTWQPWQKADAPHGKLARINQDLLAGRSSLSTEKLNRIMLEASELSQQSRGLFNPAIGQLVQTWGFDRSVDLPNTLPDPATIKALIDANHGPHLLRYTAHSISSLKPVALDYGAFLKGYAVDRAIDILRDYGIEGGLVEAGGDLRVLGSKDEQPWRIGIRNPRGSGVLASISMQPGEAMFTSGDYERYFEAEVDDLSKPLAPAADGTPRFAKTKQRFHHILDPRTGYPAMGTASVTIITDEGAKADAAATALFVAGPGKWEKVAVSMGIQYVLLVDTDGNAYLNPAMAERIKFETQPEGSLLLSAPLVAKVVPQVAPQVVPQAPE